MRNCKHQRGGAFLSDFESRDESDTAKQGLRDTFLLHPGRKHPPSTTVTIKVLIMIINMKSPMMVPKKGACCYIS